MKGQIPVTPRKGQVVIIRDDHVSRGVWKLGRIEMVVEGADGNIRTAKVQLPSNKCVLRAINQLYPLEVPNLDHDKELSSRQTSKLTDELVDSDQSAEHMKFDSKRPTRQAAIIARQRINQLHMDDLITVLFAIV